MHTYIFISLMSIIEVVIFKLESICKLDSSTKFLFSFQIVDVALFQLRDKEDSIYSTRFQEVDDMSMPMREMERNMYCMCLAQLPKKYGHIILLKLKTSSAKCRNHATLKTLTLISSWHMSSSCCSKGFLIFFHYMYTLHEILIQILPPT